MPPSGQQLGLGLGLSTSTTPSNKLLDQFGGAAAAYSLQDLSRVGGTNVVRARRSTDDAEQDFTAGGVSGGVLRNFALNNDADLIRFANQATAADQRMYFDGVNDHVRATGIDAGETGDFTASCYFMPSSFGAFEQIISNSNGTSAIAFELRLDVTGTKLQAGMIIGGSFKSATGATVLSVGTIYRVGIRRASDQLEVWLDGVKDGSATHVGSRTAQSLFCVGCRNNTALFSNGLIYDVKYWDSAISEADMLADGTGGTPSTSPTSHLQGYGNALSDWADQVGSNDATTISGSPALFSGQGFNAYVTTLYDQSGNGRNATQATAASQPQIVADGVVVTDANGKPAMDFEGTDDYLQFSHSASQPFSIIFVHESDTTLAASNEFFDTLAGGRALIDQSGSDYRLFANLVAGSGIAVDTDSSLIFTVFNGASSLLAKNGVSSGTLNAGTSATGSINSIGLSSPSGSYYNGKISEFILYASDQSTSRTAIEANIASRYGITLA